MTFISRFLILTLFTSYLSWNSTYAQTAAPEVTERKGEITETPTPRAPGRPSDMVMLGNLAVPSEVIQKLDAQQLAEIVETQARAQTQRTSYGEEVVAPALFFTSLTVISFLIIYFSFRKRREMLDTVRMAIQSGQTLPASFLEALEARPKASPDSDLRKAVLLLSLGLSTMAVLASIADKDAARVWSVGLLPTLLGLGYLFLWRQSQKRLKAGSHDEPR